MLMKLAMTVAAMSMSASLFAFDFDNPSAGNLKEEISSIKVDVPARAGASAEDGALKEWTHPDLQDNYPHRHLTHLYCVFPGFELTPERGDPILLEACRRALEMKMHHLRNAGPFGGTLFLIAGNYARLEQGNQALETLEMNARDHTHPNLFGLMQKH